MRLESATECDVLSAEASTAEKEPYADVRPYSIRDVASSFVLQLIDAEDAVMLDDWMFETTGAVVSAAVA